MTQMVPRSISMSINNWILTKVPSGKGLETKIDSIPIAPRVLESPFRELLPDYKSSAISAIWLCPLRFLPSTRSHRRAG